MADKQDKQETLSSWKEIAAYLSRTPRTCQRLERTMGLPIHRLDGSPKAHVFAYPDEIDAWLSEMIHERERKRKKRRLALSLLVAVPLVGLAAVALLSLRSGRKPAAGPHSSLAVTSVAVLPFDNLSPDKGYDYLANGIPLNIGDSLSLLRGLQVTGWTSAVAVKGQKLDVREIGRRLGVQNLVEGTVQVTGGLLRVTAHLVNTGSGFSFGARTYDRKMGDILDIQEEIVRSIAENLGERLLAAEESALRKRPTANQEAYLLYLKARDLLVRPNLTAPLEALPLFEEALKLDPEFGLAYAGVARAYIDMQTRFLKTPAEAFPKAESAVGTALALDPDLAEAHTLDAWVKFQFRWDWEAAGKSFDRAIALKPAGALTRGMYAVYLWSRKQFEGARAEVKLAIAADPYDPVLYAYSMWIHMSSGRPDEVLKDCARIQEIAPNSEFAYTGAGFTYLSQGRIDEAINMFEKASRLPWISGRACAGLVVSYLRKGDRRAAEALYKKLVKEREKSLVSPVMLAFAAGALGETDAAFDWLETAVKEIDPHMPFLSVYAATFLPDVARDPRFLAILDKLGLPH